jgi:hypothetical protein
MQFALGTGCREHRASDPHSIAQLLRHCPDWTKLNDEPSQKVKLVNSLAEFQQSETTIIRAGLTEYLSDKELHNVSGLSRVFLLNRFIFDVPQFASLEEPSFGSWRNPVKGNEVEIRWPFSKGTNGELRLSGRFEGYTGESPGVLDEFDYFAKRYGRRKQQSPITSDP